MNAQAREEDIDILRINNDNQDDNFLADSTDAESTVTNTDSVPGYGNFDIEEYKKMGIRAFIFSGYPHIDECISFGTRVLPELKTCSLPEEYGRVPAETPATPLGAGVRV